MSQEPTKTAAVTLSDKDYLRREMARRELARKSYRRYLYYVHSPTWVRTKMSDFLADTVQRFVETETGNAYDILLIETPPQHGKSLTVTESFPSWYLGKYPTHRIIEASYNDDTARKFGRKNMEKVEQYGGGVFGRAFTRHPLPPLLASAVCLGLYELVCYIYMVFATFSFGLSMVPTVLIRLLIHIAAAQALYYLYDFLIKPSRSRFAKR